MMRLENISKTYDARSGPVHVLRDINLAVEMGDHVGIVGGNGAGKSTLIRLIGGIERPTSGNIVRDMRISWPLAFTGAFQGALTGIDNIRFICRVYGVRYADVVDFVEDFSQLGRFLNEPVRIYSSGMRARLAFAISMMIDFDCYLIDEIVAVGDSRFQARCEEELFEKRADKSLIIVSHDPHYLRRHCKRASVLHRGELFQFDAIEDALALHESIMTG